MGRWRRCSAKALRRAGEPRRKSSSRRGSIRSLSVVACDALMQAMPEADWRALAHEEDAELAAVGSLNDSK